MNRASGCPRQVSALFPYSTRTKETIETHELLCSFFFFLFVLFIYLFFYFYSPVSDFSTIVAMVEEDGRSTARLPPAWGTKKKGTRAIEQWGRKTTNRRKKRGGVKGKERTGLGGFADSSFCVAVFGYGPRFTRAPATKSRATFRGERRHEGYVRELKRRA